LVKHYNAASAMPQRTTVVNSHVLQKRTLSADVTVTRRLTPV